MYASVLSPSLCHEPKGVWEGSRWGLTALKPSLTKDGDRSPSLSSKWLSLVLQEAFHWSLAVLSRSKWEWDEFPFISAFVCVCVCVCHHKQHNMEPKRRLSLIPSLVCIFQPGCLSRPVTQWGLGVTPGSWDQGLGYRISFKRICSLFALMSMWPQWHICVKHRGGIFVHVDIPFLTLAPHGQYCHSTILAARERERDLPVYFALETIVWECY